MKIERKEIKPKFEPIVITIETQEEFNALWVGLNHSGGSFKDASHGFSLSTEDVRLAKEAAEKMWFKLDEFSKL